KAEIVVSRPRVTINAAVFAAAIWVQARFETDIRTVVPSDDRFGSITKILCRPPRLFVSSRINIDRINVGQIDMQLFEPIGRAPGRASPADGRRSEERRVGKEGRARWAAGWVRKSTS